MLLEESHAIPRADVRQRLQLPQFFQVGDVLLALRFDEVIRKRPALTVSVVRAAFAFHASVVGDEGRQRVSRPLGEIVCEQAKVVVVHFSDSGAAATIRRIGVSKNIARPSLNQRGESERRTCKPC